MELEWRRCASDPRYFIEGYVWISSERDPRGRVPFELFDYQVNDLAAFIENRFVVCLKSRQLGLTTLAMAYALWLLLFRPGGANVGVVSKNQVSSDKNLGMLRAMYGFLPVWLKERGPKITGDSSRAVVFQHRDGSVSVVKSAAVTKTVFAGETFTLLVCDEAALWEYADDAYRTLKPTTDAGGSMLLISTARGAHGLFARTYRQAVRGENGYVAIFHPWSVSRLITKQDYLAKHKEFEAEPWLFYAEYPSSSEEAFRESGRPRFHNLPFLEDVSDLPLRGMVVERTVTDGAGAVVTDEHGVTVVELAFEEDDTGPLWLAELPNSCTYYTLLGDPSAGVGLDYATAHLVALDEDGEPFIAGYYRANTVDPVTWAAHLDRVGRFFAGAWGTGAVLAVEKSGGWSDLPIHELAARNYPNPYRWKPSTRVKSRMSPQLFAFPMTPASRPLVIDKLAQYVTCGDTGQPRLANITPILREELGTFVTRHDGKVAADVGCHDDMVMSCAEALFVALETCPPAKRSATNPVVVREQRDPVAAAVLRDMFKEIERVRAAEVEAGARELEAFSRVYEPHWRV